MGIQNSIINLSDLPSDFTSTALYEMNGKNEAFNVFRNQIIECKNFIFVVPEYNGSFPGVLKAFIDGLKYPDSFKFKTGALVGLSSGTMGGALALSHLSDILSYMGMNLIGTRVKLAEIEKHFNGTEITFQVYNQLIQTQIQELKKHLV